MQSVVSQLSGCAKGQWQRGTPARQSRQSRTSGSKCLRHGKCWLVRIIFLFNEFWRNFVVLDQRVYDKPRTGSVPLGRRDLRNGIRVRRTSLFVYGRLWDSATRSRRVGRTVSLQVNCFVLNSFLISSPTKTIQEYATFDCFLLKLLRFFYFAQCWRH